MMLSQQVDPAPWAHLPDSALSNLISKHELPVEAAHAFLSSLSSTLLTSPPPPPPPPTPLALKTLSVSVSSISASLLDVPSASCAAGAGPGGLPVVVCSVARAPDVVVRVGGDGRASFGVRGGVRKEGKKIKMAEGRLVSWGRKMAWFVQPTEVVRMWVGALEEEGHVMEDTIEADAEVDAGGADIADACGDIDNAGDRMVQT